VFDVSSQSKLKLWENGEMKSRLVIKHCHGHDFDELLLSLTTLYQSYLDFSLKKALNQIFAPKITLLPVV